MTKKAEIGLIGLATMGKNLSLNLASKGVKVAIYNRSFARISTTIEEGKEEVKQGTIIPVASLEEMAMTLERPRKVILLLKAGQAVRDTIEDIIPFLEEGDTLIDMGNSNWMESKNNEDYVQRFGLNFVSCGISGGAYGARNGASMMLGGSKEEIESLMMILSHAAATDFSGDPTIGRVGENASGHLVKMVHNAIEYALMQGITEVYGLLKNSGLHQMQIQDFFEQVNKDNFEAYLLEITSDLVAKTDELTGEGLLIDKVVSSAGSKGTGLWTIQEALRLGVNVPTLSQALFARFGSSYRPSFVNSSEDMPSIPFGLNIEEEGEDLEGMGEALTAMLKMVFLASFLQGLDILFKANEEYQIEIDVQEVLRVWQGGCIIRTSLIPQMGTIALNRDWTYVSALLLDVLHMPYFDQIMSLSYPLPVIRSAFNYLLDLQGVHNSSELLQLQRDYFGQHGFKRKDMEGDFHI
jgi:6-phosphogluconate dehydrogenase